MYPLFAPTASAPIMTPSTTELRIVLEDQTVFAVPGLALRHRYRERISLGGLFGYDDHFIRRESGTASPRKPEILTY